LETDKFETWAVLSLFGHTRLAGKVSEATILGGHALLRLDIPLKDGKFATRFIGPSAIFDMSPVSEEIARKVALQCEPEPVHQWELSQLSQGKTEIVQDGFESGDDSKNDEEGSQS
jgi:hypothetical protein